MVKLAAREQVFGTYAAERFEMQSLLTQSQQKFSMVVDQNDDPIRSSDDEQHPVDSRHAVFAAFESVVASMCRACNTL